MQNKYDHFFTSIRDFAVGFDLVTSKEESAFLDLIGDSIEMRVLDPAIRSYLNCFIAFVQFKSNAFVGSLFNSTSMVQCLAIAQKEHAGEAIEQISLITKQRNEPVNFKAKNIIFLAYDDVGSSFMFVRRGEENPTIYLYWGAGMITTEDLKFTSYVRVSLFWQLIYSITIPHKVERSRFEKIPWLKFYDYCYSLPNEPLVRSMLVRWRREFNLLLINENKEVDTILGIDEYEIEFIKYLIEVKNVPYSPVWFDPYTFNETFQTYLF